VDLEKELSDAVKAGEEVKADELARKALESGLAPRDVLQKGAVTGIHEAGKLWQEGEYFLPDVILATEAFNQVMKLVEPLLEGAEGESMGRVILGSVEGDAHDLGKNIVGAMLRSSLYEVNDLGVDVSADRFVEAAKESRPDVIGLGAYMTTTMRGMEKVIAALENAGLRDSVKVVIGGAAVTADYAERIGADGYAPKAAQAVQLAKRLSGLVNAA